MGVGILRASKSRRHAGARAVGGFPAPVDLGLSTCHSRTIHHTNFGAGTNYRRWVRCLEFVTFAVAYRAIVPDRCRSDTATTDNEAYAAVCRDPGHGNVAMA